MSPSQAPSALPKAEFVSDVWAPNVFAGKVIFCTGGAGTICSAQVRACVHLGANACIVGRNVEKTEAMAKSIATARKGAKVLGLGNVDVRKWEDVDNAVRKCVNELGHLDYVIAGAAGNFLASIDQLSPNAFKTVIDIDVIGSYNTVKATLPHLVRSAAQNKNDGHNPSVSTGGRIIFVSATLYYAGTPLQAHVSAAKAAVDALSNSICIEQGPRGMTSNVIAPGPIEATEGMARLATSDPDQINRQIPAGRMGTVREIADATVFLFSAAGNFINGATLVVDGGAWRTQGAAPSGRFKYPDFLLSGSEVTGVAGLKKSKI